jgi:hypothetical protein
MKTILALVAALLISASAQAQTTNTDCTVVGNQIHCRSNTQTAPPFAPLYIPPPAPQTPLLTPQMAMLIAERNRAAAEARSRDVERFTGELSSRDAWVSLKTGNSNHVRMSGDRIYVRSIVPPGASWSHNMECVPAQSPPGTWSCTIYSNVSREVVRFSGFGIQNCTLETKATLSLVSLDRITGEAEGFGLKDVNWRKCKVKKVARGSFTWIPREKPN